MYAGSDSGNEFLFKLSLMVEFVWLPLMAFLSLNHPIFSAGSDVSLSLPFSGGCGASLHAVRPSMTQDCCFSGG